jgi:hypothetical protein
VLKRSNAIDIILSVYFGLAIIKSSYISKRKMRIKFLLIGRKIDFKVKGGEMVLQYINLIINIFKQGRISWQEALIK